MEIIKFDRILSVNSEHPGHESKHLLEQEVSLKKSWLCAKGSDKGIVILKLERAAVITKVHLGNANSAFIELAVGRAADSADNFQTLVPTSTFMSPNESKAGENGNQVRFFGVAEFEPGCVGKQWDLIKVVCSQPFNKHVPYGLCFIKVHGDALTTLLPVRQKEDTDIPVGAFFRKKKDPAAEGKALSISERIREAQSPAALARHTPLSTIAVSAKISEKHQQTTSSESRKRDEGFDNRKNRLLGLEDEDDGSPSPKLSKTKEGEASAAGEKRDTPRKEEKTSGEEHDFDEDKRKKKDEERKKREKEEENRRKDEDRRKREEEERRKQRDKDRKKQEDEERNRRQRNEKAKDKAVRKKGKPFNRLLEGVVFVISGYQNPERGTYRSYGLEMGAKYRQDWDRSCTHLIAAFINTPKCNQVKGKGKIVSKDWLEQCHQNKKRYPWRRFALDKNDRRQPESEEEIDAVETTPPRVDPTPSTSYQFGTGKKTSLDSQLGEEDVKSYDLPTDDEEQGTTLPPTLPNFFDGLTFYVDDSISDRMVLERYIIAYNGVVCEKLNDDVDFFITSQSGTVLDVLRKTAKNFKAVSPTWIQSVNCNQKFLPAKNFFVE